ncbi:IclR family transcriptional regulator [Nocardia colli]|uniref:IclR family transcriptional regulator n=1 Tax=Nocardia colli TaxID=2545717 RepID=A0A5N0EJ69_9NOCA|nr:IclR family transcriptional regulator [Nocardia colli]KAA8889437.1 IclR family transcriptional regulator [Nocardia colli]
MLDKALLLMETLAPVTDAAPMGVSELARRSGLAKSTVHRLLRHLVILDLVLAIEGGYILGDRLAGWTNSIGIGVDVAQLRCAAVPYLVELHKVVPTAVVSLGILSGARVRYLDSIHGHHPPPAAALSAWAPVHCTAIGKLLLAYRPSIDVAELLGPGPYPRYTPHTRCTPAELGQELRSIRVRGTAFDRQEFRVGMVCVAAPVHTIHRPAVAAISISDTAQADLAELPRHLHRATVGLARAIQDIDIE